MRPMARYMDYCDSVFVTTFRTCSGLSRSFVEFASGRGAGGGDELGGSVVFELRIG